MTYQALQQQDGWYVREAPTGRLIGPWRGHGAQYSAMLYAAVWTQRGGQQAPRTLQERLPDAVVAALHLVAMHTPVEEEPQQEAGSLWELTETHVSVEADKEQL